MKRKSSQSITYECHSLQNGIGFFTTYFYRIIFYSKSCRSRYTYKYRHLLNENRTEVNYFASTLSVSARLVFIQQDSELLTGHFVV